MAAVVAIAILLSLLWRRKRKLPVYEEPDQTNAEPGEVVYEEPPVIAQPAGRELPPIPGVEGRFKEAAQKTQSDHDNNAQSVSDGETPPVPDSEDIYEEPALYQQLDSSKRVPTDANYQGLNAHYTKLDRSLNEDIHEYTHLHVNTNSENDVSQELDYVITTC